MSRPDDPRMVELMPPMPPVPPTPPVLPQRPQLGEDTGGDDDGVYLSASVTVFGTHRQIDVYFPVMPDDETLAGEAWGAMAAIMGTVGSGPSMEYQRRCLGEAS